MFFVIHTMSEINQRRGHTRIEPEMASFTS